MQLNQVPHLEQYFGAWAMHEPTFLALYERVRSMDIHVHLQSDAPKQAAMRGSRGADEVMYLDRGIAVVNVYGTLMKQVSSMSNGTSTVQLRQALRQASNDPDVRGILLLIESPGGTVSGMQELADDIAAASAKKTTWAYIEDLGASAAYWTASQAAKIFANSTALVGSIGTYSVVADYSGMAAMEGVKVHVVRAGEHKGTGVEGTEITPAQLAEMQRVVDGFNAFFLKGVSKGRNLPMSQVKELADGRIHMAADAQALGLIDGIKSFESVFQALSKETKRSARTMDDTKQAATLAELEAACGAGADPAFLLAQLKAGATVQQAQTALIAVQSAELAKVKAAAEEEKAKKAKAEDDEKKKEEDEEEKAKSKRPGVAPLTEGKGKASQNYSDDAIAAWNEAIAEKCAQGMKRDAAFRALAKENPELRAAFVAAHNAKHNAD